MSPDLISRICDLEWVVALKQSSNDYNELVATLASAGEKIQVLAGHSAERGFGAVLMECPGYVSSMEAQVMGRDAISMARLAKEMKMEEGRRIQHRTAQLDKGMRQAGTFPSNMKCAMNLLGRPGGYCREPLLDLNSEETARVEAVLDAVGLTERASAASELRFILLGAALVLCGPAVGYRHQKSESVGYQTLPLRNTAPLEEATTALALSSLPFAYRHLGLR
ncbi:hypothetical protein HKCCE2091_18860 [Rhodobacterales bacterium HKCCE2091]|nr:hypothetical protein [Rhodobacterales bacterium HKCCE2091]